MILVAVLALPFAAAVLSLLFRNEKISKWILFCTGAVELLLCSVLCRILYHTPGQEYLTGRYLGADNLSVWFLLVTNLLFFMVSLYGFSWFSADKAAIDNPHGKDSRTPVFLFAAYLLTFLGTMILVICSRNFGLLWVAVEATTLASTPLISYHRNGHSLEAMWKYLLICSVGIGFALLGTMFLSISSHFYEGGKIPDLSFEKLSYGVHTGWFKAAFIFLLAGYGTKMGLAPFHTWLPDAHSEAPALVSALLSGSLLNCAFLGIIRVVNIAPPELQSFCGNLLLGFGLFSMLISTLFIIHQTDFKRMLAYSSVEHMGILAIAWGMGAADAARLHLAGHTLIKGMLFPLAGNILIAGGTRNIHKVSGLFRQTPGTAVLWIIGLCAICGTPPSPLFASEYMLVRHAFEDGHYVIASVMLLVLFAVFAGMSAGFLRMVTGNGKDTAVLHPENCQLARELNFVPVISGTLAMVLGFICLYFLMKGVL